MTELADLEDFGWYVNAEHYEDDGADLMHYEELATQLHNEEV